MSLKTDLETRHDSLPDDSKKRPPPRLVIWLLGKARRVVVFVIGSTVLLIGVAMILLPGPAFIVIPLGLAILATEFVWARKWLDYAKHKIDSLASRARTFSQSDDDPSGKL